MIFSVAYPYRKFMSIIERVIYIYISSYWHIFAIPPVFIEIYRVGDNRRTVNSSTSLHISDQLGTENVWETLLCWLIVVLWVRKKMYRRERHFGSFHRYSSLLMFPIAQSNLPKLAAGWSERHKDIIVGTHTWHQCSVTISEDISSTKYDLDLR